MMLNITDLRVNVVFLLCIIVNPDRVYLVQMSILMSCNNFAVKMNK